MTERGHGSNVRDLQTIATYDAATQEFVINTPTDDDHKEWIGNAATHARLATVFAQLVVGQQRHGVHAFLVLLRDHVGHAMPGVRLGDSGHKLGLNGVDNGRIWFDNVRIPADNLLARFAQVSEEGTYISQIPSSSRRFFAMLGTLVGGRIAVASGGLSAAKSALTIAVRYGAKRRQFGPKDRAEVPVLDYLSHQRRLLPPVATCCALNFALHDLAQRHGETPDGADTQEIETQAAALKAMTTAHATCAIQEAREACGGEGYRAENRFMLLKADSDIFTTFEGDNTVLLLQAAKSLMSGYQQEFSNLDFFGLLGKLAERVEVRVGEMNPIRRHQNDTRHLLSPDVHAELFRDRERDLLISAARRLTGRLESGMDSFEAFIEVQDHLLTLANAYAQRLVLESFQAVVEAAEEGELKELLGKICALLRTVAHRAGPGLVSRTALHRRDQGQGHPDRDQRVARSATVTRRFTRERFRDPRPVTGRANRRDGYVICGLGVCACSSSNPSAPRPVCRSRSAKNWSLGTGSRISNPCTWSHPSSRRIASCSFDSTPSAMTVSPSP